MRVFTPSLFFCFFWLGLGQVFAQRSYDLHWVGFADKSGAAYSLFRPQDFLSERALSRRQRYNIKIDSSDLPVNQSYLRSLSAQGLQIHSVSRWLNGALVVGSPAKLDSVRKKLPFIKETRALGYFRSPQKPLQMENIDPDTDFRRNSDYYGNGSNQIKMLNGHFTHQFGYRGAGLWVAIIDGGFVDMRETPAFDSLVIKGQLLGTKDFIENDQFVYESTDHGRDVLSCMAANVPYLLVGTAPDAGYFLLKTEDEQGEYLSEEYYWTVAAEYADSIGVDVINSSLGYAVFDDRRMSHAYDDLDGNTTIITRAADLAAQKGILVATSAGNEGNDRWKYITAPADADSILSVAAVDRDGYKANFSSLGFKNRKKFRPNLAARGLQSVVAVKGRFDTKYTSGTSFAAPILAGAATAFWQSCPQLSNMELIRVLETSANKADNPNYELGYGIPNFLKAFQSVHQSVIECGFNSASFQQLKGNFQKRIDLIVTHNSQGAVTVELKDAYEGLIFSEKLNCKKNEPLYCPIPDWERSAAGVYYLTVNFGKVSKRYLLVK